MSDPLSLLLKAMQGKEEITFGLFRSNDPSPFLNLSLANFIQSKPFLSSVKPLNCSAERSPSFDTLLKICNFRFALKKKKKISSYHEYR